MLKWWLTVLAMLAGGVALSRFRARRQQAKCPEGRGLYPECLWVVTVSGDRIVARSPEGTETEVRVSELVEVFVETNDSGPWGADVWWHWYGAVPDRTCVYPGGATGEDVALRVLQAMPGFGDAALREAMGCTSNRLFAVYRRAA